MHLQSGATANAGLDWNFVLASVGASIDFRQPSWAGAPNYLALNPYFTWHLFGGIGVSVYGTIGLTRSSPSSGAGIRVSL